MRYVAAWPHNKGLINVAVVEANAAPCADFNFYYDSGIYVRYSFFSVFPQYYSKFLVLLCCSDGIVLVLLVSAVLYCVLTVTQSALLTPFILPSLLARSA